VPARVVGEFDNAWRAIALRAPCAVHDESFGRPHWLI